MSKLNSILLVEDDSITNFINERLLRKLEIADDIKMTSNGLEAITVIQDSVLKQQGSPNLIFLDINMPVMDGFEFLSEFRMLDIPNKENIVVIVLTTSTNLSDTENLKGSGNTDFINKPLTKEKIQNVLEKYFTEVAKEVKF